MKPMISIIIPVYNSPDFIEKCLESIQKLKYPKDRFETIIVDNNSADNTREIIKRFEGVTLLLQDKIQSSYASRNLGIKSAKGEILAFTDADCIVSGKWLNNAVECLQGADIVAGKVEFFFSDKRKLVEFYDAIYHMDQENTVKYGAIATANLVTRRHIFDEIGLFEDSLVSSGDTIWSQMAFSKGLKLQYCEDAVVHHPTRQSLRETIIKQIRHGEGEAQIAGGKLSSILYTMIAFPYYLLRYSYQPLKKWQGLRSLLIVPLSAFLYTIRTFSRLKKQISSR